MQEFSIVTAGQPKGLVLATQQQKESFSIKSMQGCGPPIWYWGVLSPRTKYPGMKLINHPHLKIKYCVELYLLYSKCLHGVVIG